MSSRLEKQIDFILEVDKSKRIFRRSYITGDDDRLENDAEHCWHLAMMALVLSEHANEKVDICKVLKMVLVHDIVEIDAGDTFVYDEEGAKDKPEREQAAAERIFSILPEDQTNELRQLWDEFEEGESPESKFARSLDRMMPILHNYHSDGKTWKEHGIKKEQVLKRNSHMEEGAVSLWEYTRSLIDKAVENGFLSE